MLRSATILAISLTSSVVLGQDFGPIQTRNQRALSLPFLRLNPRWGVLKDGEREKTFAWRSANDSRYLSGGQVEEDQETNQLIFGYRQGISRSTEWAVKIPYLDRSGGFLDPIITWWHKNILRWQDPYRASQPNGRTIVNFGGKQFGSASGFGDIDFSVSRVYSPKMIGTASIKLPTGSSRKLLGSGGVDLGIGLKSKFDLRSNLELHVLAGAIYQGATSLPGARRWIDQENLALVWKRNSRDAWIGQWMSEASAFRTGISGSDATQRQIVIGYQRKIRPGELLELHFCEDRDLFNGKWPEGANVAPDFAIGVSWSFRF